MLRIAAFCVALFFVRVAEPQRTPYVIRDALNNFALCMGTAPSEELKDSLLMCRELAYPFCVNASVVASLVQLDDEVLAHFTDTVREPSVDSIERLAHLVDSSLVVLYERFAARANAQPSCAYEWHAWLCSRVFRRADANFTSQPTHVNEKRRALPVDVCRHVCERTELACESELECAELSTEACTDYYNDSITCGSLKHAQRLAEPERKPDAPSSFQKAAKKHWSKRHSGAKRVASDQRLLILALFVVYFVA